MNDELTCMFSASGPASFRVGGTKRRDDGTWDVYLVSADRRQEDQEADWCVQQATVPTGRTTGKDAVAFLDDVLLPQFLAQGLDMKRVVVSGDQAAAARAAMAAGAHLAVAVLVLGRLPHEPVDQAEVEAEVTRRLGPVLKSRDVALAAMAASKTKKSVAAGRRAAEEQPAADPVEKPRKRR